MASPKTVSRLNADIIRSWRTLDDAPGLTPLATQRRTLREQRHLLMAKERERLTVLAQAYAEQQRRLARMDNADISAYPPFDASHVQDAEVLETRETLLQVSTELLHVEDTFQEQSEPVIGEFAAVQKALLVHELDRILEALETIEDAATTAEGLCLQSWGVITSYITDIGLFARLRRTPKTALEQERTRLANETEAYYA